MFIYYIIIVISIKLQHKHCKDIIIGHSRFLHP